MLTADPFLQAPPFKTALRNCECTFPKSRRACLLINLSYPYCRFLRAPHTGSLRVFKENFCNKTEGADRLHLFLRQFMIRRTHNDSLFGSKLLSLKPPSKHDHKCHFSDIERAIYNVLHKRFVARINGFARTGQMKKQYSSVLTMILRLRQVVAHPLLVQDSLRDLLEPVDFAHLKQICDMPVQPHMTEYHILQHLRMMLDHDHRSLLVVEPLTPSRPGSILDTAMDLDGNLTAENQEIKEAPASSTLPPAVSENPEGTIEPTQPEQARDTEMIDEEAKPAESSSSNLQAANEPGTPAPQTREPPSVGGQFGLRNDYGDFFADLQLTSEINEVEDVSAPPNPPPPVKLIPPQISTCTRCRQKPIEPHKTSCMHIYCRQCLMIMSNEAVAAGSGIMKCIACGNTFHGSALYTPTQTVKPSDARGSPVWDVDMTALKRERGVAVRGKGPAGKGADVVSHWVDGAGKMLPSAKTLAFKAQVANWLQEDPNVKIIVYTQFISMIQILGKVCEMEGWDFLTFHGSHDIVKRNKIVEEFRDKEDVKVLLSSLKTGGTGLNLVMASRVILIDLWWNTVSPPSPSLPLIPSPFTPRRHSILAYTNPAQGSRRPSLRTHLPPGPRARNPPNPFHRRQHHRRPDLRYAEEKGAGNRQRDG